MTDDEALRKAQEIVGPTRVSGPAGFLYVEGDTEGVHIALDDFLCELLKAHGYTKLVDYYKKLELWYA